MGIFSKPKKKEELVLVFDVGSSSVGGALFYMRKEAPKIIFSIREPVTLEKEISFGRFLSLVAKSLDIVANKISTSGLGAPKKIFCVLSSPWYASQIRTIKLKKNAPFTFTSKLADGLIQKEISIFEEEYSAKYMHSEGGIRPIELKNMKTTLNGYATLEPMNQKAKELEMTVFISLSPEQVLGEIEDVISRHFHRKDVKFSSFAMASFAVTRDIFAHQENFLLVDVGGEVTDISMVKKDALCGSFSFPMGCNFMIRGVAKFLDCALDEAKSFISIYKSGHASESINKKLEPVINKLKTEWLKKFQESLADLSNNISIPATVFMTVDQDLADFFAKIIRTEQYSQYILTESKFKVIFLGTQMLHGIAVFRENTTRDPFLIIGSVYINRFFS